MSHGPLAYLLHRASIYPWRSGNRFELLPQGQRYFPAMIEAIEQARRRVGLEVYWMTSGGVAERFITALSGAAERGVEVFVLIDDYASADLAEIDRRRLTSAGVHLARFNPLQVRRGWANLVRDHRKLLVIDEHTAFVGGTGICDEFDGEFGWRENMLRLEGECVADWWHLFRRNWQRWSEVDCPPTEAPPAGRTSGRVVAGGRAARRPIRSVALQHIRRARTRVWLATPYFLPPRKLRRALGQACRAGLEVQVLIPSERACDVPTIQLAGQRYYGRLLRSGVRLFEYDKGITHEKVLLADDRVMIGSCNFDRWGLHWNLEANQAIRSREFARTVSEMLAADRNGCREITLDEWRSRSLGSRLRTHFWSWLALAGMQLSYRSRVKQKARRARSSRGR